ncbi:plasmid pRiA4b ORF-3 family protein [Nocardia sp. NPDC050630]|uniref:plasmid pRiA4b ORF-3 family protein n=1 Tax=Nocardia sp. NPDC050630 TaxID=3364321 RepID=UPI0037B01D9B
MSKRTPAAKRPGNHWPTPLFDVTAPPPDGRVDDAGDGSDPRVVMEAVLAGFAEITDPVEAEVLGSMFLGAIGLLGAEAAALAASELVPVIEAVGDSRAAGMLAVLATLEGGRIGEDAAAGLNRLRAHGVAVPEWTRVLSAPVTARDCVELCQDSEALVLAARFDRAGAGHAVMILLDPRECGEAAEIMLLEASDLTEALAELRQGAERDTVRLTTTALDPAEFRWRAEAAMDARDHHDRDDEDNLFDPDDLFDPGDITDPDDLFDDADLFDDGDDVFDDDGPGYHDLASLLRARLAALPASTKPKPPHGRWDEFDGTDLLAGFDRLAGPPGVFGGPAAPGPVTSRPKLPAKRKTRDGQAPILQLRVDLRGAKPPIWRRLQVPGDIALRELHELLQVAFGWHSTHLYAFGTAYGGFGVPDPELGLRSDAKVTLEQVAGPGTKLTYIYDFGDDWVHVIAVEHTVPRADGSAYPRCVGGRRKAPPEDCGGTWGYQELLEILDDPAHEEHEDRLQWLGIDRPDQHHPAHFDIDEVNDAFTALHQNPRRRK